MPAFLSVVDIAGLVRGANEGQGLGNAFLSHISGCDAIFHVTRAFDDSEVRRMACENEFLVKILKALYIFIVFVTHIPPAFI